MRKHLWAEGAVGTNVLWAWNRIDGVWRLGAWPVAGHRAERRQCHLAGPTRHREAPTMEAMGLK